MVHGLPVGPDGTLSADAVHALPDLDGFDAVVAGPGLGHGAGAAAVVAHLRGGARRLVLDADALNVHRDEPEALADHAGALVLTPHERELARIGGGADGRDAWANRVARVPDLAARYDAVLVAKGPGTIVAAPDGRVWVTPNGGPALGSGGTGDVLAGIIGAAVASGPDVDVPLAVARAVWWHAAAGVRAGQGRAGRATAVDLLAALPGVLGLGERTERRRRCCVAVDGTGAGLGDRP
jgi:NAD(P)H-hydrate epimerase